MDTTNRFMVGSKGGGGIVVLNPPSVLSKDEAMMFAAWIVTLASIDEVEFQKALGAVQS